MTVLTSDLNLAHWSMIKACGDQGERGVRARGDPFSFVGLWYEAIFESCNQTVVKWANDSREWVSALRRVGLSADNWRLRLPPELLRMMLIMNSVLGALRVTAEPCLLPCSLCESCKRQLHD